MALEEGDQLLMMFVLGIAAGDVVLTLIVMDLRRPPVLPDPAFDAARHFHGPDPVRCAVAQEKRTFEALDLDGVVGRKPSDDPRHVQARLPGSHACQPGSPGSRQAAALKAPQTTSGGL